VWAYRSPVAAVSGVIDRAARTTDPQGPGGRPQSDYGFAAAVCVTGRGSVSAWASRLAPLNAANVLSGATLTECWFQPVKTAPRARHTYETQLAVRPGVARISSSWKPNRRHAERAGSRGSCWPIARKLCAMKPAASQRSRAVPRHASGHARTYTRRRKRQGAALLDELAR
jgi:hypothetical protein